MISVADAQAHVLALVTRVAAPEVIPVVAGLGRVLAEDVRATLDVPPTANSAVAGYAVRSGAIPASGTRELTVVADLAAGAVGAAGRAGALAPTWHGGQRALCGRVAGAGVGLHAVGVERAVGGGGGGPRRPRTAPRDVGLPPGGVAVGDHDLVKAVLQEA